MDEQYRFSIAFIVIVALQALAALFTVWLLSPSAPTLGIGIAAVTIILSAAYFITRILRDAAHDSFSDA